MYLLTRKKDDVASGTFATIDTDGTRVIQFFVNKDDAITYNTMLEALGQKLHVTETDDDMFEKISSLLGHAYTVVDEGDIVIPKLETLHDAFLTNDSLS